MNEATDETKEMDLRVKREADILRKVLTFEDAIQSLALYRIFAEGAKASMRRLSIESENFVIENNQNIDALVDEAIRCSDIADAALTRIEETMDKASRRGKKAADTLHSKPGGSRDKKAEILKIWATNKYWSRDLCAEEECAGIGLSFTKARKHLIGTSNNPMLNPKKA